MAHFYSRDVCRELFNPIWLWYSTHYVHLTHLKTRYVCKSPLDPCPSGQKVGNVPGLRLIKLVSYVQLYCGGSNHRGW